MSQFEHSYSRGHVLYGNRRFALAEKEFRQALTLDPDNPAAHAMLALCLGSLGHFPQAKAEAEESIRLGPDQAFSHYTLSLVLSRGFNFERTKLDDLKLDDRVPFEVKKLVPNGSSLQATQAAEEAVRLQPESPAYLANLAQLRVWSGKFPEGLALAEQGLARVPTDAGCLHARIMALAGMRRHTAVQEAVKQFLSLHPEHPLGHNLMGQLKLHGRHPQEAQEYFLESLRMNPASRATERALFHARHRETLAENLEIMRGKKKPG
jgi:tetratricopeptide (TPR) repeat protein